MIDIIKRDKKRQKFVLSKLERAIDMAAKDAKVAKEKRDIIKKEIAQGIQQVIKGKRSVKAIDIRRMTLRRLESRSRATRSSWILYDRKRRD